MNNIIKNIKNIEGNTISSIEVIMAEFGRTYDRYTCIKFKDGTRVMIDETIPYEPDPTISAMKDAPKFFTSEDISRRMEKDKRLKERREKQLLDKERREYERLKKKFEKVK